MGNGVTSRQTAYYQSTRIELPQHPLADSVADPLPSMDPRTPNQLPFSRPSGYSFGIDLRHAPIPPPPYSLRQPLASTQRDILGFTQHRVSRNEGQVQFRGTTAPNHAPNRSGQTTFASPFLSETARRMTHETSMRRNSYGPEAPYKDEMIRRLDDQFIDGMLLNFSCGGRICLVAKT